MGYGLGITLIAIGLIIAFAVDVTVQGVDLYLVGIILAAAGLATVLITAIQLNSGPRR